MQLSRLTVEGFRGIRQADLRFGTHSILSGPNNSGKTTVIEALALVFGRDKLVRELTEHDFFGSAPAREHRLKIVATITGFTDDDPARHPDWFRAGRAIPKWLNPQSGALEAEPAAGLRLACQIGFAARFDHDELSVETLRYFHDRDVDDVFDDEAVRPVPTRLLRDIGFFLVPGNRTWDRTISFGSELFRRVVQSIGGQPAAGVLAERDRLRSPEEPLDEDAGLTGIVTNVNSELAGLFPGAPRLTLRLTATDSESVLGAVVPHFVSPGDIQLPAKRQGSGLVSMQHLLLLLQFGRIRAERNEGFLMALEEPELHVPPPVQRRLTHRIQSLSTQTIIATHSPIVAAGADPTSLLVLKNRDGNLTSAPLLAAPLPLQAPNWQRNLYFTKRQETITALMHDLVLVPEGRTDYDLLRLLVDSTELRREGVQAENAQNEFGARVGMVPTQDAKVVEVYSELSRLHGSTICLVDGDGDGLGYAVQLTRQPVPPGRVLAWPDNWSIESVVGWVAEADPAGIAAVATAWGTEIPNAARLVELLKTNTNAGGRKGDLVAYESAINAIADVPACLARARGLLSRITQASGAGPEAPEGWARDRRSTERTSILRFIP